MTRISIALCTYNGERYLPEQLQSYLQQTRLPDELVACDDGSTDNTVALLDAFAQTAPFEVRVIRNPENLGYAKNFEKALTLCTGDFIALSDQDDVWLPEKLAWSAEVLENNPRIALVFGDAHVVDSQLDPLGYTLWQALDFTKPQRAAFANGGAFDLQLVRNHVTGATSMVRAEHLPHVMPFPKDWVHDDWMATIMSSYAQITLVDQPTMLYRQHANNQLGIKPGKPINEDGVSQKLPLLQRIRKTQKRDTFRRKLHAHLSVMIVKHLRERQQETHLSDATMEKIVAFARHTRARGYLPLARWRRVPTVFNEFIRGRYHRFSSGGILPYGLSIALSDLMWTETIPTSESVWSNLPRAAKDKQGLEIFETPPPKV